MFYAISITLVMKITTSFQILNIFPQLIIYADGIISYTLFQSIQAMAS